MSYRDLGFDEFLQRTDPSQGTMDQQFDPSQFDNFTDQISGSKIQGGLLSSGDGKTQLDLENGTFKVKNGLQDLVTLGRLDDGSIGLLIKDNNGNILFEVSAGLFLMQSTDQTMSIDLVNGQIVIREPTGNIRAIIGKYDA